MGGHDGMRPGERAVPLPPAYDAGLYVIGRIRTPWPTREACPRQGRLDGPTCTIEVFEPWREALEGIDAFERLDVLYWLDRARRDLVLQSPRTHGTLRGTFALRSPVRPNPIGLSRVALVGRVPEGLAVTGLDCVDGTPLLDVKPFRCAHSATSEPDSAA